MLTGKAVPAGSLSDKQIETMFLIMNKYYKNITNDNFVNDLKAKREVILLCDEYKNIRGFTTLSLFLFDENTQLLFSGDTIVEKEYWGKNNLSHAWIINALGHAGKFHGKTYWLLLTKGYKTYKFLHTFFIEFYPKVDTETPPYIQNIIDTFAIKQFGEKYKNGIYAAGKDSLKEEIDDLSDDKRRNKNTAFFLEKNPNYKNGDELVCLCELSVDNINKTGKRVLDNGKQKIV